MIPNKVPDAVEHLFNIFKHNLENGLFIMMETGEDESLNLQSSFKLPNAFNIGGTTLSDVEKHIGKMFTEAGHKVLYLSVYSVQYSLEDVEINQSVTSHYSMQHIHFDITYLPKEIA